MNRLIQITAEESAIAATRAALEKGRSPALITGLAPVHRALAAAALVTDSGRPVVVICADDTEAGRMASDLRGLLEGETLLLTGRDLTLIGSAAASHGAEQRRLQALDRLTAGAPVAVAATMDGLMLRTMPHELFASLAFDLKLGDSMTMDEMTETLVKLGYTRSSQVEGPGQFARRGGIIDVFSPNYPEPLRIDFFGDDIDSLGFFDVASQRRQEGRKQVRIIPAAEALPVHPLAIPTLENYVKRLSRKKNLEPRILQSARQDLEQLQNGAVPPWTDRYLPLLYPEASAADYLPPDALVILSEPGRLKERAKNLLWQMGEDLTAAAQRGEVDPSVGDYNLSFEAVMERLTDYAMVMMDSFTSSAYPLMPKNLESVTAKQLPSYGGSLETAMSDVRHYVRAGFRTVLLCQDERRAGILAGAVQKEGLPCTLDTALSQMPSEGCCTVAVGSLTAGLELTGSRLAILTEGQIVGQSFRKRRRKKAADPGRQKLESFTDLSPGDLVVHANYGIGRFVGIVQRHVDGADKDYIKIAFAGSDALYIPATQLDMIAKYIGTGGEDAPVRLSKLGTGEWQKTKTRARAAARELARGLIALQAERRKIPGFAFSPDSVWQTEFEEAFGYQETDDQLRCIREIKDDMERPLPMDRLLCGDVGYGKTEVALRAVMKCVMDGKQAAILVPMTVLAQQHYQTIMRRFAGYPVNTELLCRFRTPQEIRRAVAGIQKGSVDIVVGTHRLLQKDVQFKDLGLLIVDEEQRFGVAHKERLKELTKTVDVLTLSATPIPRTLNMALSGIRDMSTIEEPPMDRQPVQTYVMEHDWSVLADAIRRELSRGGQVYYLHNLVQNIERTAIRLHEMLGDDVNIAVAHGQMPDEQLSDVMQRMADGEIQVLVCTTIIETGLDITNVNTLIIEDADKMGLAQLHQIRGRVGRSNRRAYAYFTFRKGKVLSEDAEKRLNAIREFAEFNSGFKIAMRDLEIRGAGNLLGAEQSGHMMSVGYDMYLQLIEEAVLEEKGERVPVKTSTSADLSISAYIPETYVASGEQRMDLYRRIARIETEADADDMTDELIDRFGEPPAPVNALVLIALLRGEAAREGILDISQKGDTLRFTMDAAFFDLKKVTELGAKKPYKGNLKVEAASRPVLSLRHDRKRGVAEFALQFVRDWRDASSS